MNSTAVTAVLAICVVGAMGCLAVILWGARPVGAAAIRRAMNRANGCRDAEIHALCFERACARRLWTSSAELKAFERVLQRRLDLAYVLRVENLDARGENVNELRVVTAKLKAIEDVLRGSGGVFKCIDENRELLQVLKQNCPRLLDTSFWIEGCIHRQDSFLVELANATEIENPCAEYAFPRPWPGRWRQVFRLRAEIEAELSGRSPKPSRVPPFPATATEAS